METKAQKQPEQAQKGQELALLKKNLTDSVMARLQPLLESKELRLPPNYSPGNALQSAWFDILEVKDKNKNPALQVCSQASVANALYRMVIMGLSSTKKQVDFIVYGDKLICQPEYAGNMALAKRYGGVKEINAGVIYKGDVFEYTVNTKTGRKQIVKHEQELDNIDNANIRGAYAVLTFEDSEPYVEIMNMVQIKKAWEQGQQRGNGEVHKNFTDQMAIKTVINRACKLFIRSSDDGALFDDDEPADLPKAAREETVKEKSGKKVIPAEDIDYEDVHKNEHAVSTPEPVQPLSDLGKKEEETQEAPNY